MILAKKLVGISFGVCIFFIFGTKINLFAVLNNAILPLQEIPTTRPIDYQLGFDLEPRQLPPYLDYYLPDLQTRLNLPEDLPDNFEDNGIFDKIKGFVTGEGKLREAVDKLLYDDYRQGLVELRELVADNSTQGYNARLWLVNAEVNDPKLAVQLDLLKPVQESKDFYLAAEASYIEARYLYLQQKYPEAIALSDKWSAKFPNINYFFKLDYIKLQALLSSAKFDDAKKLAGGMINQYYYSSYYPELVASLALAAYGAGDYIVATDYFSQIAALSSDPKLLKLGMRGQAWSLYLSGQYASLGQLMQDSAELNKAEAQFFKTILSAQAGDLRATEKNFELLTGDELNASAIIFFLQQPSSEINKLAKLSKAQAANEKLSEYVQWSQLVALIKSKDFTAAANLSSKITKNSAELSYNNALIEIGQNNYNQGLVLLKDPKLSYDEVDVRIANYYSLFKANRCEDILKGEQEKTPLYSPRLDQIAAYCLASQGMTVLGFDRLKRSYIAESDRTILPQLFKFAEAYNLHGQAEDLLDHINSEASSDSAMNDFELNDEIKISLIKLRTENKPKSTAILPALDSSSDLAAPAQDQELMPRSQQLKLLANFIEQKPIVQDPKAKSAWVDASTNSFYNYYYHYLSALNYFQAQDYSNANNQFKVQGKYSWDEDSMSIAIYNELASSYYLQPEPAYIEKATALLVTDITSNIKTDIVVDLALVYQRQGDFALAEQLLFEYRSQNPQSTAKLLAVSAENSRKLGSWEKCLEFKGEDQLGANLDLDLVKSKCATALGAVEVLASLEQSNPDQADISASYAITAGRKPRTEPYLGIDSYSDKLKQLTNYIANYKKDPVAEKAILDSLQDYPELVLALSRFWDDQGQTKLALDATISVLFQYPTQQNPSLSLYLADLLYKDKRGKDLKAVLTALDSSQFNEVKMRQYNYLLKAVE